MPTFFHVSGSLTLNDTTGRQVANVGGLRREALATAANAASLHASRDEETCVIVTVRDLTGAVCLRIRLLSQVEGP